MKIVVCIKQTPLAAELKFNEETKTIVREGVRLSISSIDRRALLEALRLKGEVGGTVTALTMGPPQAKSALVDCLALGADDAVLLTDRQFAGADTLATSRALAAAIKKLSPDLVVCGKFTVDSETSQVPSELAELLDYPQVTCVRKTKGAGAMLWVERETDEGFEQYEVSLPALISVTELVITNRQPAPEAVTAAATKPVTTWTAADLGGDPQTYGAAGSPTRVAELRSANLERKGRTISGENPAQAASEMAEYLLANGLFKPRAARHSAKARRSMNHAPSSHTTWVVAELLEGKPRHVSFELLGAAQDVADRTHGEVVALLLGGPEAGSHAKELGAYGADTVYVATDRQLAAYDTERYTRVVAEAIMRYHPHVVLFSSTTNGRDLAPRVAARLQLGLTGDAVGIEVDAKGDIAMIKPAFGGNIVSPIYSRTTPVLASVRPGALEARTPDRSVNPKVVTLAVAAAAQGRAKLVHSGKQADLVAGELDDADVVVGVGQGIGGAENLPAIRSLAAVMHGTLAATLRAATIGTLPPQLQLGLTGRTIAPRFYLAIAASGQANHLFGVKKAEHVLAINNDPAAPIFKSANLGIVGDWKAIVPVLTEVLAERASR